MVILEFLHSTFIKTLLFVFIGIWHTLKVIITVVIIIIIIIIVVQSITKNKFLTARMLKKIALEGIKLSVNGQILIGHVGMGNGGSHSHWRVQMLRL